MSLSSTERQEHEEQVASGVVPCTNASDSFLLEDPGLCLISFIHKQEE